MNGRKFKNKFDLYRFLDLKRQEIFLELKKAAKEIGISEEHKGKIGATGAISSTHSTLRKEVIKEVTESMKKVINSAVYLEKLRDLIKDVYGDNYDATPVSTCEAALWVCFDSLVTPAFQGRGDKSIVRYIVPYEKHLHHHGAYGRPFPPKYKDLFSDRGVTAGELGFYGKRLENLETVIVPLVGAKYEVHGIKEFTTPLLLGVNAKESYQKIKTTAERHADKLAAFASLGYDLPGYGYGEKDDKGAPLLQKYLGKLSKEYDIPYIVDNAWGLPIIGTDLRQTNASLILYSMDKVAGAPTSGLIIGEEEYMINILRALGMHSQRYGIKKAYGKAAYVTLDPGKEAIAGQVATLSQIKEDPSIISKPLEELYNITLEVFESFPLRDKLVISKSLNSFAVEINYEKTWDEGRVGIPIFTIEDMYAGSNLIQEGMKVMGIIPTIAYDANIMLSPGLGTLDEEGNLIHENAEIVVKAIYKILEIFGKYVGLF
ncbi:hypothetical protein [Thermococcus sp.]|uniref:hypothetical protein n=1 Tax=Thermococcus sp. TaxID=35749 RepID=UPI002639E30D|nr:hypothetical protein [Thermococcus sp.]MCD6144323.1 hypothetical protein [Thermococcus sp.]